MFILLKTRDSRGILLIKRSFLVFIQVVYIYIYISAVGARATSRKVASSIPDRVFFDDIILPAALWPWPPLSP